MLKAVVWSWSTKLKLNNNPTAKKHSKKTSEYKEYLYNERKEKRGTRKKSNFVKGIRQPINLDT